MKFVDKFTSRVYSPNVKCLITISNVKTSLKMPITHLE